MSSKDDNQKQFSILTEIENVKVKNERKAIERTVKDLLSKMYSSSESSRFQIAANISEIQDSEVSDTMLNNYTSEAHKEARVPVTIMVLSTIVCRNYALMHYICEMAGGGFVEPSDLDYLQLMKVQKSIKEMKAKETELQRKIGEK